MFFKTICQPHIIIVSSADRKQEPKESWIINWIFYKTMNCWCLHSHPPFTHFAPRRRMNESIQNVDGNLLFIWKTIYWSYCYPNMKQTILNILKRLTELFRINILKINKTNENQNGKLSIIHGLAEIGFERTTEREKTQRSHHTTLWRNEIENSKRAHNWAINVLSFNVLCARNRDENRTVHSNSIQWYCKYLPNKYYSTQSSEHTIEKWVTIIFLCCCHFMGMI